MSTESPAAASQLSSGRALTEALARPASGYMAVALGALRAGVRMISGYPAQASGCVTAAQSISLAGCRVEACLSPQVAVDVATGAALAGQRALCALRPQADDETAGAPSVALIALRSMPSGSLVVCIEPPAGDISGMAAYDLPALARAAGLPLLEPASVGEAFTLAQAAFKLAERGRTPVLLCLPAMVAGATGSLPAPGDRPAVTSEERAAGESPPVGGASRRQAGGARLMAAERAIRELALNRLYLAPRDLPESTRGRVYRVAEQVAEPRPAALQPAGGLPQGWYGQLQDALRQVQEAIWPSHQSAPGSVSDGLRRAQDLLHQALARESSELLEQAVEALESISQALPGTQPPVERLQEALRQLQDLLPDAAPAEASAEAPAEAPAGTPQPGEAGIVQAPQVVRHPVERNGLGIITAGITAALLDEAIAAIAAQGVEHWEEFGPQAVSVLKLAGLYPVPAIELQALMRHCSTLIVLETGEPHIEREVLAAAWSQEFEGTIIGKLNGFFGRGGPISVQQVVCALAAVLEMPVPAENLRPAACVEMRVAQPLATACEACPQHAALLSINDAFGKALRELDAAPVDPVVVDETGCPATGYALMAPRQVAQPGAGISLAQGLSQACGARPAIVLLSRAGLVASGLCGLLNAVQGRAPLTLFVLDRARGVAPGMPENTGLAFCAPETACQVDLARLAQALGIQHFALDPRNVTRMAKTLARVWQLPGVKLVEVKP